MTSPKHGPQQYGQELLLNLAWLVERADDAIISIDLAAGITYWNAAAETIYGYTREEMLGRPVLNLVPPERKGEAEMLMRRLFTGEPVRDFETERLHKDGRRIPVSLTATPIRDDAGRIVALSSISRDISERKRQREELHRTAAELARSNADLEQFAYVASHDLQEPLRMLTGYLQLLQRRYGETLDRNAGEFLRFALEGAARMSVQIDDLLLYSRVGSADTELVPVDCAQAVERALANLQAAVAESDARVTWDELPTVDADREQLIHLFQNLIANALKFRSAEPPRVRIAARNGGDEWILTVRDNGIGVDPRYTERIFGIFERLHTREEYPGTGIGLAICKRIVERHGGRIGIEPGEGGAGSTFFFTLPSCAG